MNTPDPSPEPAAPVSMTPRTDAATHECYYCGWDNSTMTAMRRSDKDGECVDADFARALETENTNLQDALKEILTEGTPSRVHEIARNALETKL